MKSIALILMGVLVGISTMIYIYTNTTSPLPLENSPISLTATPAPIPVLLSEKTIITRLERIGQLHVLTAHIDTVSQIGLTKEFITNCEEKKCSGAWIVDGINDFLGKRVVKMQGRGDVNVYIDLSNLPQNSIVRNGNKLTLTGMKLKMDKVKLDTSATQPLDLRQGILIPNTDFGITALGYDRVTADLQKKSCDAIVAKAAKDNAIVVLEQLIKAIDPETQVDIIPPTGPDCN
jgi:hypothetical protein